MPSLVSSSQTIRLASPRASPYSAPSHLQMGRRYTRCTSSRGAIAYPSSRGICNLTHSGLSLLLFPHSRSLVRWVTSNPGAPGTSSSWLTSHASRLPRTKPRTTSSSTDQTWYPQLAPSPWGCWETYTRADSGAPPSQQWSLACYF